MPRSKRSEKKGRPMAYLSKFLPKILIFIAAGFILIGCSTIDRLIHPTAKPSQPEEPVIEQVQKEQSPPIPPPEPMVIVPATLIPSSPPPSESPKVAPLPILRVTEVVWASVNLREGPGMSHKIVGNVKKGTSVAVLEDKGQWLHIRLEDGKEVWIFKSATMASPKSPSSGDSSKPKPMSIPKPM